MSLMSLMLTILPALQIIILRVWDKMLRVRAGTICIMTTRNGRVTGSLTITSHTNTSYRETIYSEFGETYLSWTPKTMGHMIVNTCSFSCPLGKYVLIGLSVRILFWPSGSIWQRECWWKQTEPHPALMNILYMTKFVWGQLLCGHQQGQVKIYSLIITTHNAANRWWISHVWTLIITSWFATTSRHK